jgi:hypothetical protein
MPLVGESQNSSVFYLRGSDVKRPSKDFLADTISAAYGRVVLAFKERVFFCGNKRKLHFHLPVSVYAAQ